MGAKLTLALKPFEIDLGGELPMQPYCHSKHIAVSCDGKADRISRRTCHEACCSIDRRSLNRIAACRAEHHNLDHSNY